MFLTSPLIEQAIALKTPCSRGSMSEMAMLRQPPHGNARAETHPGRVMSRPSAVRGYIFIYVHCRRR